LYSGNVLEWESEQDSEADWSDYAIPEVEVEAETVYRKDFGT